MKPPTITYPGGKSRLRADILSFAPCSGRMYVEAFAGRGNVFWAAALQLKYESWWINDIRTAGFFEALRRSGSSFRYAAANDANAMNRDFYRFRFESSDAAKLLEPLLSFNGGSYLSGGPRGNYDGINAEGYRRQLERCSALMQSTEVKVTGFDWTEVLPKLSREDFCYLDPPYLATDPLCYSPRDLDHCELVRYLRTAKFRWLLSGYETLLYNKMLGEPFDRKKIRQSGRAYRTAPKKDKNRLECLWAGPQSYRDECVTKKHARREAA